MNAVADAVLMKGPVEEKTATIPVANESGFVQSSVRAPPAAIAKTHFGETAPSAGAAVASKSMI